MRTLCTVVTNYATTFATIGLLITVKRYVPADRIGISEVVSRHRPVDDRYHSVKRTPLMIKDKRTPPSNEVA
jgi:hypothetical protein